MKTYKALLITTLSFSFIAGQAQIIHVPGDYQTIQEGIDAAQFFGDTVLVDDGTYIENINYNGKLITVASQFIIDGDTNHINNTVIDGSQPSNPDEGSVVSFRNNEDSTAVLCGFTITGGTGTMVSANNIRTGGGVIIENANPKILHNRIIDNHIETSNIIGSGGGLTVGEPTQNDGYTIIRYNHISYNTVESSNGFVEGGGISIYSHAIIEHNEVSHNEIATDNGYAIAGGIRVVGAISPRYIQVNNNIISYNMAYSGSLTTYGGAGGMQAINCWGNISHNTFQGNEIYGEIGSIAGGLHFKDCGIFMKLENNMIIENAANYDEPGGIGGGVGMYASNIMSINNIIARNYAENGSGIQIHYNFDGPAQFINNTITYNEGDGVGGAIYINEANAVFLNSILWENGYSGEEIYLENSSNVEVAYSDVTGGWIGTNNINVDPEYLDDFYHLDSMVSQCINAGIDQYSFTNVNCNAPPIDFDGEMRPQQGYFDIGADEEELFDTYIENHSDNDVFDLKVYPNPSSGAVHLRYSISDIRYSIFEVYSSDGVVVKSLPVGYQPAGEYTVDLDLSDLPDGIYFIRLQAGEMVETAKIILMK